MGKRRKKVKSLRGYATTSTASLNETLGLKSEREEIAVVLEEPSTAARAAEGREGGEGDGQDSWETAGEALLLAPESPPQEPLEGEQELEEAEDDAWLTSRGAAAADVARRRLRRRKPVVSGPTDPCIELKREVQDMAEDLLRELGLVEDVTPLAGAEWSPAARKEIRRVWRSMRQTRLKDKLMAALVQLEDLGFNHEQIRCALERCGHHVAECVDWLTLHVPEEQLPRGWTIEEGKGMDTKVLNAGKAKKGRGSNRKGKPRGGKKKNELPEAPAAPAAPEAAAPAPAPPVVTAPAANATPLDTKCVTDEEQREMIKRLHEMQEREEEERARLESATPREKFERLAAAFRDLRAQASTGSKAERREISVQIRGLRAEMDALIAEDPELADVPVDATDDGAKHKGEQQQQQQEQQGDTADEHEEGEEDALGGLFAEPDETEAAGAEKAEASNDGLVKVDFDLSSAARSSTQDPSRLLEQHVKQNFGRRLTVSYTWTDELGPDKWRAEVGFQKRKFKMPSNEYCEDRKSAREYVALLALFKVAKNRQYSVQMSAQALDLWRRLKADEEQARASRDDEYNLVRAQLISDIVAENCPAPSQSAVDSGDEAVGNGNDSDPLFDEAGEDDEDAHSEQGSGRHGKRLQRRADPGKSEALQILMQERVESAAYAEYAEQREDLPVMAIRDEMVQALDQHDVLVLSGSTGSGKTTQVPHLLLQDAFEHARGAQTNIIVTEPRRISAVSVAERVSCELADNRIGDGDSLVGYQIRGQKRVGPACRLMYCTTGIVLRLVRSDPELRNYSHIVVDEVHERTVEGDLLINILRTMVRARRDAGDPLKVVLMSATIDLDSLSAYFGGAPVVQAGGRSFPVAVFPLEDAVQLSGYSCEAGSDFSLGRSRRGGYRDDEAFNEYEYPPELYDARTLHTMERIDETRINYDLILDLLLLLTTDRNQLMQGGAAGAGATEARFLGALEALEAAGDVRSNAILVFLPGLAQIQAMYDRLSCHRHFADPHRFVLLRLHSSLSSQAEQRRVFALPRPGAQKIILSTNIAETGVTIPDVCYVIDTGKVKEMSFRSKTRMQALEEVFVSRASLKQRAGRAGRTRPGVSFQLLSSQLQERRLRDFGKPEIQRVPLEGVILQIMTMYPGADPWDFLAQALDPPPIKAVDAAADNLEQMGALERLEDGGADEGPGAPGAKGPRRPRLRLTPLGQHVAKLPCDYKIAKMLLYGALFQCLDPVLTIAASIGSEDQKIFLNAAQGSASEAQRRFVHPQSDLLTYQNVYRAWSREQALGRDARNYCRDYSLSHRALQQVRKTKQELLDLLKSAGFCDASTAIDCFASGGGYPAEDRLNKNSANVKLLCSVLCAGLFPNIARPVVPRSTTKRGGLIYLCKGDERVGLVTRSTNSNKIAPNEPLSATNSGNRTGVLTFLTKMKTGTGKSASLWDSTFVPPAALLLFTNTDLEISHATQAVKADWLTLRCLPRPAAILKRMRAAISAFLREQFARPASAGAISDQDQRVVDAIVQLVC